MDHGRAALTRTPARRPAPAASSKAVRRGKVGKGVTDFTRQAGDRPRGTAVTAGSADKQCVPGQNGKPQTGFTAGVCREPVSSDDHRRRKTKRQRDPRGNGKAGDQSKDRGLQFR
jgi:hypothetical protein